jgi:CRP/FNR family transcriptional regulator, dissimilatory nitrate respiration regulator
VSEPAEIMLLALQKVIHQCPAYCSFHSRLIESLMQVMAEKNLILNRKISFLSYKTTRHKIAALLLSLMNTGQDTSVTVPFSRDEMADYFGLNRSALSRELSRMRTDGIIDFDKSRFFLKDLPRLSDLAHD